jgi:hypothetical protein
VRKAQVDPAVASKRNPRSVKILPRLFAFLRTSIAARLLPATPAQLAGHLGADRPLATLTVGELEVAVAPVGTAKPRTCDLCRVNESPERTAPQ